VVAGDDSVDEPGENGRMVHAGLIGDVVIGDEVVIDGHAGIETAQTEQQRV
jgi:UDP-3-O-[3-hydroxymyristoyl] glucosamine N-acyltransferase